MPKMQEWQGIPGPECRKCKIKTQSLCRRYQRSDRKNGRYIRVMFTARSSSGRTMGDVGCAVAYFQESVEFLMKLPMDDLEIIHTISVSLNKIGDLKYYDGDLQAARSFYVRSLNVRRDAIKHHSNVPSQTLDVAVSLAKVADVDRSIGSEDVAIDGFKEAIKLLEPLVLKPEAASLEQRRLSVLEFLNKQLSEKQTESTPQV